MAITHAARCRLLKKAPGSATPFSFQADLIAAAREAMNRRERNTADGGAVIAAMIEHLRLSYRDIERLTGIPRATAQRWAEPPKRV